MGGGGDCGGFVFFKSIFRKGKKIIQLKGRRGEKEKDRGRGRFVFALRKGDVVENEFLVKWSNTSH